MKTMVSPDTTPIVGKFATYQTTAPGLPVLNVRDEDAVVLGAAGWRDALTMTQMAAIVPLARNVPVYDAAGNFTANNNYAGLFPAKNVEDALAQLAARLTHGGL